MRNAETILNVIRERGRQKRPLERIYRLLFNRDLYLRAYGRLHRNDGAMTPGATAETVDAMSLAKIDAIIDAVRQERYRWMPVRRAYVPKKTGKRRALGLPTWSDKLLQEVVRSILDAYYEPQFSRYSHGFRPNRGCHTALGEITKHWRGVKWFIEGDIKDCFGSLDHTVLLAILSETIQDNRFLRLIANLLEAGYLEQWRYHATFSGVPQGSVVGPVLSNIYLDRLDQFVETALLPAYNRGKRRKPSPTYMALVNKARRKRMVGQREDAQRLRRQAQRLPSREPDDPHFRRLWYARYADDWLLGFTGPKVEAEAIKRQLAMFLQEELKLELSQEKTLITHARTEAARFLGYDIVTLHEDAKHHRAQHRRCINGVMGLKVPTEVIRRKCAPYLRDGKPVHRPERTTNTDYSIVAQYQAEYRGLVQYYLMAFNVHRLWRLHRVMALSLAKTLANKHKTSVCKVYRKHQTTIPTPHGTHKVLQVVQDRGPGKEPLVARFGGIELRWQTGIKLYDRPTEVYSHRSEVVERLLAQQCELCGAMEQCEVHHIRKLADLDKKGQRPKPLWVKRMAARQRKTLVVCRHCHEAIHREGASKRKQAA